jgi:hypothetical protein
MDSNFTPNSPISKTCSYTVDQLSTPKTNKSSNRSPVRLQKIKKSRRRECTPAYSPPESETKGEKLPLTAQIVSRVGHRLTFDDQEDDFPFQEDQNKTGYKRNFLALIEESLNDVSESYFGVLSNQTTPDLLYRNIFGDEKKENPEIVSKRPNMEKVLTGLNEILIQVSQKNFSLLEQMVSGKYSY